jgi:hypothetical protein
MPLLTIGMATHTDERNVEWTLAGLREQIVLAGLQDEVEVVVVDNNPTGPEGARTKSHCTQRHARYEPFTAVVGTSAPRNHVFNVARGEWVLCIDSHVSLIGDTLTKLVEFCRGNSSDDLYHATLINESVLRPDGSPAVVWTHWIERWGSDGMFGKAASIPAAALQRGEPLPIGMAGLGLFLARRESWLRFSDHQKHFGGEEGYIHQKYRVAGRQVMLLPWALWWHRFAQHNKPFPTDWESRANNYVDSFKQLGFPALSGIRAVHLGAKRIKPAVWAELMTRYQIDEAKAYADEAAGLTKRQMIEVNGKFVLPELPGFADQQPAPVAPVVTPPHDAPMQPDDVKFLAANFCPHRGRNSGTVLCNVGCTGGHHTAWSLFDCKRHGLVTLGTRRKELKSCVQCIVNEEDGALGTK